MQSRVLSALRSTRRIAAASAVALSLAGPQLVSAQTVTFESLNYGGPCQWGGGPAIASGYAGFSWGGFNTLSLPNISGTCGRSTNTGYQYLQSSIVGNVVALGSGAAWLSSSSPFVLSSFIAGAGWISKTTLTLGFYLNGALQGTRVLALDTAQTGATPITAASLFGGATDFISFTPNYSTGTDVFNSAAESCFGVTGPCTPTSYKTYFLDNLKFDTPQVVVVTATPEPGTVALLGFGLLFAGIATRRRRQQQ